MRALSIGTAAVLVGSAALAQDAPPAPEPVITRPDWVKRPSGDDLAAVFPAEALKRGQDGRATLSCEVSVEGTLQRCRVVDETPRGLGYGHAALALAPQFLLKPKTVDGKPVAGGVVRPTIVFKTGGPTGGRSAPSSGGGAKYVTRPIWIEAPTRAQVAAAYPAGLKASGGKAQVQLDCGLDAAGRTTGCTVAAEEPKGGGAGRAAMTLARSFRTEPTLGPSGTSVRGARVRIPVTFAPSLLAGEVQQIARPEWGRLPEATAVASGFPAKAKAAGVQGGGATLDCRVQAGGRIADCSVLRETPAGMDFGQAALALAPSFAMSAWTSDGRPVDGARVRIPVRYQE